jgi:hypothetical protein
MFVFTRPAGTVTDDRARSSSTGRTFRSFVALFHRPDRKTLAQLLGLAWVAVAIIAWPVYQANLERDARQMVKHLGGRYNVDRNTSADVLPARVAEWFGGENLHPVRSVNLSRCDVTDEDLALLLKFKSLEQVNLCGCNHITTEGVARLWRLPRMKLVWVDGMTVEEAGRCLTGETIAAAGY